MTRTVHMVAFAAGPGGGNPCPVVFGADGMPDERMLALAREYGRAEADGWHEIVVHQGEAMSRPSLIRAAARRDGDLVTASRIAGTARRQMS